MLTKKQEAWLNKLSNENQVKILPYNSKTKKTFKKLREEIQSILGAETFVLHKGASAWGISGKGDLDIYIPVTDKLFKTYLKKLGQVFGEPGGLYILERARWNRLVDRIETELFLINENADFWKESLVFWEYIENHPETLKDYEKLKENAENFSTRQYYRVKIEFYNKILILAKGKDYQII